MAYRQKMFIFGHFKACISNFADYNLYQSKLNVITRKEYAFYFSIRPLDVSLQTREESIHLHESPKKNLEVVSKIKGILLPRNYVKFTLVKVTASKIAYTSLEMTKNEHFLTTSHRKVVRENFFRDFGYIMLLKNSSRLIRVINRTNSQPNWTRRSEKRYN